MRITRATTYIVGNPWKNWLFVRLETEAGLYGIGEGTLNAFARTVEAAIQELAPRYMGMDPFQIETIYQRMTRDVYSEGGQIHLNAVAAIEIACWDIIGKAPDQPIYNLLGGRYHETAARLRQRLVPRRAHAGGVRREGDGGGRARLHGAEVRPVRRRLAHRWTPRGGALDRHRRGGARGGRAGRATC